MSELRFDGKVAVITGAGGKSLGDLQKLVTDVCICRASLGALGRAYALMFASRGASVVVSRIIATCRSNHGETLLSI